MNKRQVGRKLLGSMLAATMLMGNGMSAIGIPVVALASETTVQPEILSQAEHAVTIGMCTTNTCGLFITSDLGKTTVANVGFAGNMECVNGYAQWTITNKPVMDGAGFTNETLTEGDTFRYWIRMQTSAGEVMMGPYSYTHHTGTAVVIPDAGETQNGEQTNPGGTQNGEQINIGNEPETLGQSEVAILNKTESSVTIGLPSTAACGLFVTSDLNKTTIANVGYAGNMECVNGYAQWTIANKPVMDGAGFTNDPLAVGDSFRFWIRTQTDAGETILGPYDYTHTDRSNTGSAVSDPQTTGNGQNGGSAQQNTDAQQTIDGAGPQIDASLTTDYSFMYLTLINNTEGEYTDDEIFVTILGRDWNADPEQPFSYMTADGRLPLISTRSNDKSKMMYNPVSGLADTNRSYANLGFTIADVKALGQIDQNGNAYIKLPPIRSGRMYLSYGEDICIEIKGADFAGPALDNPTDPNQEITFDFVEFTYNDIGQFWGNTTRVDGYVFPISIRLVGTEDDLDLDGNVQWLPDGSAKQKPVDKWVGDLGEMNEIFEAWAEETRPGTAFEKFNHLLQTDRFGNYTRIVAPGKGQFDQNETGIYKDYFDAYISRVWNTYTAPFQPSNPMIMTTQAGRFVQTGIAGSAPGCNGNYALVDGAPLMVFKHEVWNKINGGWYEPHPERRYYIHKPTTAEVLEGKGAFDHHHAQGYDDTCDLVIESQLCAAFNRGVAHLNEDINMVYSTDPTGVNSNGNPIAPWGDVSKYYVADGVNQGVFNFYAMFWHRYGVNHKAYGFCYDDVWDQSTLLYARYAQTLAVEFGN